ncbi:bifunctional diaminohydroxyphosphoribosylaminopyrimidine deaminase/5-amino-6-(5-phosphoribosylamino)uracil reductase RibD [Alphaproteobacteria bacterium]|nr:bifunctional diaminohydroxyphosphoribosylaminopyrimidine deaminase/5-amino-6-(5-phosphoribosylamino)uracil reductase RibD [Alphaproteobacteria bacterium]
MSKKSLVNKAAKTQDFRSNPVFPEDTRWMRAAIMVAKRGIGRSGANPPVGCVLIGAGGQLLASGHTGAGGVPHAESVALADLDAAGRAALQGGTAYVTLEPCAHHGKTPPCADALIAAGIARLVVAIQDPDLRVNGNGLAQIAKKGIIVCLGVEAALANESLKYFIHKIQHYKPYCSLKIAASLDGQIALSDRKKRWLTGPKMRRYVHFLRSQADAIITGIGTVLADDPKLNCRNEGLENDSPPVFIFDRLLRIPTTAAVLQSPYPVTLFCSETAPEQCRQALDDAGCVIVPLPDDADGRPDIGVALHYMGARGVNHALVEAGTGLVTSFLAADAADCIYWTQSNHILGGNSLPAVGQFTSQTINAVAIFAENRYIQTHYQAIGHDRLIILQKRNANTDRAQA